MRSQLRSGCIVCGSFCGVPQEVSTVVIVAYLYIASVRASRAIGSSIQHVDVCVWK